MARLPEMPRQRFPVPPPGCGSRRRKDAPGSPQLAPGARKLEGPRVIQGQTPARAKAGADDRIENEHPPRVMSESGRRVRQGGERPLRLGFGRVATNSATLKVQRFRRIPSGSCSAAATLAAARVGVCAQREWRPVRLPSRLRRERPAWNCFADLHFVPRPSSPCSAQSGVRELCAASTAGDARLRRMDARSEPR